MNALTLAAPSLANAPPLELIDAAAAAGFQGVGLRLCPSRLPGRPFFPVVGNAALVKQIQSRLADTGLFVLDIYSFYLTPDFDESASRAAMEVSAQLGARFAVVVGYDSDEARARDTFIRICEMARSFGLTAAVEFAPLDDCWPATLAQAAGLLEQTHQPNATMMPDPTHLIGSGGTIAELRSVDPKYIGYSQICDIEIIGEEFRPALGHVAPTMRRHLLGEGKLRVPEWMDALPRGIPVSVECVPQPAGLGDVAWATALYTTTRRALDAYYAQLPAGTSPP